MKWIHPRRWLRKFSHWYGTCVFRFRCQIHHVHCEIGENTRLRRCRVKAKIDGTIVIGSNCYLQDAAFNFYGSGGRIELRDGIKINAHPDERVVLLVRGDSSIFIDDNCLFSNTIEISTTDWHPVYDLMGNHLNPEKDVRIGKRVWVGRKVTICKGVSISDDTIVGVGSIVTRSFSETNVIVAGNPAEIKKRGVYWRR